MTNLSARLPSFKNKVCIDRVVNINLNISVFTYTLKIQIKECMQN